MVGANRPAQALVVVEDGAEAEGQHRGVLKAVGNHTRVIHAAFLVEGFLGVVLADNDNKVVGGINKNLVAADSEDRFHRGGFAMTGRFRKCLFFTDTVGIPCHDETLRLRALESATRWGRSVNVGNNAYKQHSGAFRAGPGEPSKMVVLRKYGWQYLRMRDGERKQDPSNRTLYK